MTSDLLLHNANEGTTGFFSTNRGLAEHLHSDTDWSKGLTHIVAGDFGGGNGHTDLLLHNANEGTTGFFSTNRGLAEHLHSDTDWSKGLTHIVAGDFGGGNGHTDLLLHNANEGTTGFFSTNRGLAEHLHSDTDWSKGLTHIVAGDFAGAPTELTTVFSGTATLRTTHPDAAGPFKQPISLSVRFSSDRSAVEIIEFPDITVGPFNTPLGPNTTTIRRTRGGSGSFEPGTGGMSVTLTLLFDHSHVLAGDSTVDLNLTTGTATSPNGAFTETGSPLVHPSGKITLVGASIFKGGFLGGRECSLVIGGAVTPAP